MNSEDEIFNNFIVEMDERLQDLEDNLAELDQAFEADLINALFRSVHTIKGGSSFFGLSKIQELSHEFEDLLMKIREGDLDFDKAMMPAFFAGCDSLKGMHEANDHGASMDVSEVCRNLREHHGSVADSSDDAAPVETFSKQVDESQLAEVVESPDPVEMDPQEVVVSDEAAAPSDDDPCPEAVSTSEESSVPEQKKAAKPQSDVSPVAPSKKNNQNETIRVNVDLLNKLMDLTGEIVLGRNQLLRQFSGVNKPSLASMAHMISDLQQLVLQTRMQPIGSTFTKFNRIVRDLTRSLGKEIRLVIKGQETELDRSIIEALSDPLTHLIRNCADHGLETPEERIANGKDRVGTILLEARQEGGQVAITVKDDGRGIDAERVKGKALASQAISPAEAEGMSENEAARLIFHPGLSTAEKVTSLSGRGVGMDVVKSTFEKLGGAIDLETKLNEGTNISIHLPTTLSIMSSLIVRIGSYRFAVPHSELKEVIPVRPEDELQIENIRGKEVYRLRGSLIPILSLGEITEIDDFSTISNGDSSPSEKRLFLVLHSGTHHFGLLIDSIDHTEEIVVKPLAKILSKFSYYAGSSILGDSDVAMVLSANGISQSRNLRFDEFETYSKNQKKLTESHLIDLQEKQDLLVFKYASDEQLAIPLSLVFKVEQINPADIQTMANKHFVSHEGRNVLLLYLDNYLNLKPLPEDASTYYLILPKIDDFNVGIVASVIEESVHMRLSLDSSPMSGESILGITTIRDQVTYLIDLFSLFEQVSPDRFQNKTKPGHPEKNRLLVVEDTPFFRHLEKSYFESVGFKVTQASNGKEALDLLRERPKHFHLVVSDIVMPIMDGYELVKNIKGNPELEHLPVIAITSFTEEEHRAKALSAGFDDYAIKTNKENILQSVSPFIEEQ
jgi:two-component system, chemotaxis family, sensor kinase CheA